MSVFGRPCVGNGEPQGRAGTRGARRSAVFECRSVRRVPLELLLLGVCSRKNPDLVAWVAVAACKVAGQQHGTPLHAECFCDCWWQMSSTVCVLWERCLGRTRLGARFVKGPVCCAAFCWLPGHRQHSMSRHSQMGRMVMMHWRCWPPFHHANACLVQNSSHHPVRPSLSEQLCHIHPSGRVLHQASVCMVKRRRAGKTAKVVVDEGWLLQFSVATALEGGTGVGDETCRCCIVLMLDATQSTRLTKMARVHWCAASSLRSATGGRQEACTEQFYTCKHRSNVCMMRQRQWAHTTIRVVIDEGLKVAEVLLQHSRAGPEFGGRPITWNFYKDKHQTNLSMMQQKHQADKTARLVI